MVRRNHVIAIGQRGNQVAEHVRAGRESVQQYQRGRVRVAGLTEEQPVTGDRGVAMVDDWHEIPPAAFARPIILG